MVEVVYIYCTVLETKSVLSGGEGKTELGLRGLSTGC